MKNLYLYLSLVILILTAIYCSDSQNFQGRMNPKEQAAQLKERLDLTDEQTQKVEKIYTEWRDKLSEMRDQFEGDRDQMREQMIKSREELNSKIEEILYDDQIEPYREYQGERRQLRRDRRGQRQR